MSALSPVDQQASDVKAVFDQAVRGLEDRIRRVTADHAAKGLLQSGGTVRKFGEAFEAEARGALAQLAPLQTAAQRSPVMRVKLAEAVERGVQELEDIAEGRLRRLGLSDKAAADHLAERRRALDRPVVPAIGGGKPQLPSWAKRWGLTSAKGLAKWLVGAVGAIVLAYVLKTLGLG